MVTKTIPSKPKASKMETELANEEESLTPEQEAEAREKAKSLVKKLLKAELSKRYGNLKNGFDDIKQHKWFKDIDWEKLLRKELHAPFKPLVKNEHDYRNFEPFSDDDELPPQVAGRNDPFASWLQED